MSSDFFNKYGRAFNIVMYIFIAVITFFILFEVLKLLICDGYFERNEISFVISSIRDFFNIIFFSGILIITILSYIQAKKSLFTPIKTETFKMQIKSFEEILFFFQNKRETDFIHQFDIDNILKINAENMFIDYIDHFFKGDDKLNSEKLKERKDEIMDLVAGSMVSKEYMEKHFSAPKFGNLKKSDDKEVVITNPAIILSEWNKYDYGKVDFTKKYSDEVAKLNNLSASPLLPEKLKNKILDFENKVTENLSNIGEFMTEISKEMPNKFPTVESLSNFEDISLWNRYNKKRDKIEGEAYEILKLIRDYLKIDDLIH